MMQRLSWQKPTRPCPGSAQSSQSVATKPRAEIESKRQNWMLEREELLSKLEVFEAQNKATHAAAKETEQKLQQKLANLRAAAVRWRRAPLRNRRPILSSLDREKRAGEKSRDEAAETLSMHYEDVHGCCHASARFTNATNAKHHHEAREGQPCSIAEKIGSMQH